MTRVILRLVVALCLCGPLGACEDDPCDGVTCSGHGTCLYTKDKTPYCECDPYYYPDGLKCILGTNNVGKQLDPREVTP